MGVTGLWPFLSGLGTAQSLSEAAGMTLAVDLSAWICQARSASTAVKQSPRFFMIRTIFYRTIELLKYGVKLVFVLDGEVPRLKQVCLHKRQTVRGLSRATKAGSSSDRSHYKETTKVVVELLESLGLPVIHSPGEAEKMCAYLNSTQRVDAVLTDDGDAFLYGAGVIMRKFDKSDTSAVRVSMADIEGERGHTRRSLIGFALLSGCDYNEGGVKGVGPEQIRTLFDEMRRHCTEDEDILHRILGWKDNRSLLDLAEMKKSLDCTKRETHCSRCCHTGTVTIHHSKGCEVCQTECECQPDSGVPCDCTWHHQQREINPYGEELRVRDKALEDTTFTELSENVVREFTEVSQERRMMMTTSVNQQRPCLERLCQSLKNLLHMDSAKVITTMIPVLAYMHLREEFDWSGFKPISIQKACQRNFVDCYQTVWSKLDDDRWTTGEFYTIDVEENLFQTRCPEHVSRFVEELAKKKVPVTPGNQSSIRDMLLKPGPLRKKSEDERQNEDTPLKPGYSWQKENVNKCKKKIDFDTTRLTSQSIQKEKLDSSQQQRCVSGQTVVDDDQHQGQVSSQTAVDDDQHQRQVSSQTAVDDDQQQRQVSSQAAVDEDQHQRQVSSQTAVDDDQQQRQVSSQTAIDDDQQQRQVSSKTAIDDDQQQRQVSSQTAVDDNQQQRQVSSKTAIDDDQQQRQVSSQTAVDDDQQQRQVSSQAAVDDNQQQRQVSSQAAVDGEVTSFQQDTEEGDISKGNSNDSQDSRDNNQRSKSIGRNKSAEVVSSSRDEEECHSLISEDLFSDNDDVEEEEVVIIVSDSHDSDSGSTLSNGVRQHLKPMPVGLEDPESDPRSAASDDVMLVRSSDSAPDLALDLDSDPAEAALAAEETNSTSEDEAVPNIDGNSNTSVIVLDSDSDSDVEGVTLSGTARKRTISGIMRKPAKKSKNTISKEPVKKQSLKANQTRIYNYFPSKKGT
ncbi:flap endonuclease GEN homolog 1-like [Haliotis cracherodii]|uniref:flap endonuclease GEN homolog 1-like n=1 Tax=Haliotis cracherodii TaxID=6455 RepID=UPI0039EB99E5